MTTSMKSAARGGIVVVGSAAMCLSMSACGGKSHKAASSAKASASSAASSKTGSSSSASASSSTMGASSSASSAAGSTKSSAKSAAGCVTAKIGGKSKCIKAGQMCSHKNASQYTSYGFTCDKKGQYYMLKKA